MKYQSQYLDLFYLKNRKSIFFSTPHGNKEQTNTTKQQILNRTAFIEECTDSYLKFFFLYQKFLLRKKWIVVSYSKTRSIVF